MLEKIKKIKEEVIDQIEDIKDSEYLRELELKYLGRKGELTKVLRGLKDLSEKNKKEIGMEANKIKNELRGKFNKFEKKLLKNIHDMEVDVTVPGKKIEKGHLNPLTLVQNDMEDIFISLGFDVLDGPELESDYYCFEALNITKDHPARDMQDTFYIDKKNKNNEYDLVMRTHTSPVQIRAMQKYGAPLRIVVPGRVFRNETIDSCHEHTFNQMECLMIDKNISIANFKAIVKEMISRIFEYDANIRLRPGYFPFVEPGFEIDMSCTICNGAKCPSCKYTGWLELGGAGMVHPNVLKAGGIDPEKYSGFAFGFGINRIAMMKYEIDNIRLFNSGDKRFLDQF